MSGSRAFDIAFLQADSLYNYSKKAKITLNDAAKRFERYHIFKYIYDCYELLHLYGSDAVVSDISKRIKEGIDFA